EALTVEEIGRRFFAAFRGAVEGMAATTAVSAPAPDRRTIALLQLIRVLFLYFIQARGWLDGSPVFLRDRLDQTLAQRRRLHRDLFRPLFFGTLNRRLEDRGRSRGFGRIPFLNGGLFEPHPLERRWRPEVPNEAWRAAFDDVFERFHFTLDPAGRPGTVAPDMLGHVFEQLMAPEERRRTGAFYTPGALVARTVELALGAFLVRRLDVTDADAEEMLRSRDARALGLLREITILDPAAGSGAFLLGVLERLADLRRDEAAPAELRRRILERNLFGVDLNPMAVTLAELRLWLAVIAADDSVVPEAVRPLPNLDGVVRQGDSLLEPSRVLGRLGIEPGVEAAAGLRRLRPEFMRASGAEKPVLLRRLRRTECGALRQCLVRADDRLEGETVECLSVAHEATLFGGRRGLDRDVRRRLRSLRGQRREVRRLLRQLERAGEVPWFSFEAHFGDVLAAGGFDCILGNPPWVRAEQLSRRTRTLLSDRFRWWRTGGAGFSHQPDLALAFVERGLELLKPGGVLAFLLPVKVATAGYARVMRRALAGQHALHVIADLADLPEARFAAVAYPALLVASRGAPPENQLVRLALGQAGNVSWPQRSLEGGAPWQIASPALLSALAEVREEHPTVGARFTPQLGVKTGANEVFLDPPADIEAVVVRRALRGRDLRAFRADGGIRLLFPHGPDDQPLRRLPVAALRHVTRHEALLRSRADHLEGPPWILFRVRGAMGRYRVIWPDLARTLRAVALTGIDEVSLVPLNSCYVITTRDRGSALALAAWLNCTWIRVAARSTADRAASGFARFNARVVRDLPLPARVFSDPDLPRLAIAGARGADIQEELDDRCGAILALSPPSRAALLQAARSGSAHRCGIAG
ncbi:MAG: N-6 DNA methylase, partial [Gemmatimonadota bacterium]|nr:N-6 DNA methylase [Gemmatimonadota bacterium]